MIIRLIYPCLPAGMFFFAMGCGLAGNKPDDWWDSKWPYRMEVAAPAADANSPATTVWIDFAGLLSASKIKGKLDPDSLRVVEAKNSGEGIPVPALIEERLGNNGGWGYVTWLKGSGNTFHIYFDTLKSEQKPKPSYQIPPLLESNSVNLVRNGSFEDINTNGLPVAWECAGYQVITGKTYKIIDPPDVLRFITPAPEPADHGKQSMKFDLGKAVEVWDDFGFGQKIPASVFYPPRERNFLFCARVYIEGGNQPIPIIISQYDTNVVSGRGWFGEFRFAPALNIRKQWQVVDGKGELPERTSRINLSLSTRLSDRELMFYLDNLNLQFVYPPPISLSLDKKMYYFSDKEALATVKCNLNNEILLPQPAVLRTAGGRSEPAVAGFKVSLNDGFLQNKKLRLTVEGQGKQSPENEWPLAVVGTRRLDISGLTAGVYKVKASLVDNEGKELFSESVGFERASGPFD